MATYAQANRQLTLSTPLGEDVLLLTSFSGREEMSRLFQYRLEMLSEKDGIAAKDIVGKGVTWTVQRFHDEPRFFNGFVSRFSAGPKGARGLRHYSAEVVPWLWFLTRTADCRIFQNKSVPDIVQQIFQDLGFTAFEVQLKSPHPKWDYCVQYRETDLNFVSRLMEQEGIFYFFRHANGSHKLILADQKSAYQECVEGQVEYSGGTLAPNHVTHWEHDYEFRPGKFAHTDYNFETPDTSLMSKITTVMKLPNVDKFEIYDYPGEYEKKADGDADIKVRIEEQEAAHDVVRGASTCCTFTPGGKFTLSEHECASESGKDYVITSVHHQGSSEASYTGNGSDQGYSNTFTCLPATVTFRPARLTAKPIVQGPQTAVVVGPAGEEIYTDNYSRVKVQFHWDREGKRDENSSCWIRVSTTWAGTGWGFIQIPRIGQEVIVAFLEGDPDRPLIIGNVYNADKMPPYSLPAHKTQSGVKSRSSLGGSAANCNEIRFEDLKGKEQLFIHAEKNQDIEVENDETHWVGHDRKKTIDHDETTHVKHDRTETVDNNETITIHANRTETVDKDETIAIHGNRAETVDKDETITIHGSRTETVDKDESISIHGGRTEVVDKDESISISGARTESVSKDQSVSIGKNDSLNVGKALSITAGDSITLTTGSASITMQKDGTITISGKDITINGSGEINGKASKNITLKGQKILQN